MAGRSYDYDGKAYLPHPSSLSPDSETPVSLKPNVNRMKTKRWVEAKKFSYDGDDWGDDEYGEYDHDEEELPPVPPVPPVNPVLVAGQTNATSGPISNTPVRPYGFDRSVTTDTLGSVDRPSHADRSQTFDVTSSGGFGNGRAVPFVRPADIYKRMREERQRQGTPQGSSPSSGSPRPTDTTSKTGPRLPPRVPEQQGGFVTSPVAEGRDAREYKPGQSFTPSSVTQDGEAPKLPEIKRLSTGFLGTEHTISQSPVQESPHGDPPHSREPDIPQESALRHNSSLGFRSAVNQAFDVPETPSIITDDSLVRSNSDSTSAMSPIISSRAPDGDKTPTIAEEPSEVPTSGAPVFKPGHRRDLSLPSSDNSPSKRPDVHETDSIPHPKLAELSSVSQLNPSQDGNQNYESETSRDASPQRGQYQPLPLRLGQPSLSNPQSLADDLPAIVPQLNVETSPQDTESDRLRKEIILSLSRENSPGRDLGPQVHESQTEAFHGDNLAPNDTSRLNDYQVESPSDNLGQQGQSAGHDYFSAVSANLASTTDVSSPADAFNQDSQPKRSRRFSWESSDSDVSESPDPHQLLNQPEAMVQPYQIHRGDTFDTDISETSIQKSEDYGLQAETSIQKSEDYGLQAETSIQKSEDYDPRPGSEGSVPLAEDSHDNVSCRDLPIPIANELSSPDLPDESARTQQVQFPSAPNQPLLAFREILGIRSSQERIRAFDRTRYQFASIDTGLGDWIEATILAHPEYSEIVEQNQEFTNNHNMLPSKAKFPKLTSLGNLASHLDGPGSIKRQSAQLGSQRRGKEILHSAGLLGGKAGGAARGLFAKGRSKLRSDKVYKSLVGHRKGLSHPGVISLSPEDPAFYGSNPLLGTSIDLATLLDLKCFGSVEVIAGIDPNEALEEETYSGVAEKKQLDVASDCGVTGHKKGILETLIPGFTQSQAPSLPTEYLVFSVPTVNTNARETSRQTNSTNNVLGSSSDFEQELISALGLDNTDSISQELLGPGLLSGNHDDNRPSLAASSYRQNSPAADNNEAPTRSYPVSVRSPNGQRSGTEIEQSFTTNSPGPPPGDIDSGEMQRASPRDCGQDELNCSLNRDSPGNSQHSARNGIPENYSETLKEHGNPGKHMTSNNPKTEDPPSESDEDDHDDSSPDLKVADFTIVRPVRENRVNLLINGQPVDTFNTKVNVNNTYPSSSDVNREAKSGSVAEASIGKAENTRGILVQDAKSQQRVDGSDLDRADSSSAAKKADRTTADGSESDRANSTSESDGPGSNVARALIPPSARQNSAGTAVSSVQDPGSYQGDNVCPHPAETTSLKRLSAERQSSETSNIVNCSRVHSPGVTNGRRLKNSNTPLRRPQGRFYGGPVVEQRERPRSSTVQTAPSSSASPQLIGAATIPRDQQLRPNPDFAKRNSFDTDKKMAQIRPGILPRPESFPANFPMREPDIVSGTPKQSPRASMQRSTRCSLTGNTESTSSESLSTKGLQSPLKDGYESLTPTKRSPVLTIDTLGATGPDSHRSFDSEQARPAAPFRGHFRTPSQPPSVQGQTPMSPQKGHAPMERWRKMKFSIPFSGNNRLDSPQRGTFNKLSGLFRRSGGRDIGKEKASARPSVQTPLSSQPPRMSLSQHESSPSSRLWFSPDDVYSTNCHRGLSSPGDNPSFPPFPPGSYHAPASIDPSPSSKDSDEEQYISEKRFEVILDCSSSSQTRVSPSKSSTGSQATVGHHPDMQPPLSYAYSSSFNGHIPQNNINTLDYSPTPRASISSFNPKPPVGEATTTTATTSTKPSTTPTTNPQDTAPPAPTTSGHPHRGEARAVNAPADPVELPISGDDSSEEIVMSSTAYPGQEWKPAGLFGDWGYYC